MSEKILIILTHHFPVHTGEEFLIDELEISSRYFSKIILCPVNGKAGEKLIHQLPENVELHLIDTKSKGKIDSRFIPLILSLMLNEFFRIPNKILFFKTFKFNLAFLKQCYLKSLYLKSILTAPKQTTIYSYWCDELATIAAFTKLNTPEVNFISRAHGFEVFEEQSDSKHIFFRSFQLSLMNQLWSVSQLGAQHLKLKNKRYSHKIDVSYLGIDSNSRFVFENTSVIRLVTCSKVRSIKRLELLAEALKSINQLLVWEVIGDGDDLEKLKVLSKTLPENIQVIFHGNMTIQQIHELYSSKHFDFLVSLSSSEGLPVSMMEAISHGIPILSTDVGGCKEIVTNQTGILIPANFELEELTSIILNCKSGQFNSQEQRKKIIDFWNSNFKAENNYKKFSEAVLKIQQ